MILSDLILFELWWLIALCRGVFAKSHRACDENENSRNDWALKREIFYQSIYPIEPDLKYSDDKIIKSFMAYIVIWNIHGILRSSQAGHKSIVCKLERNSFQITRLSQGVSFLYRKVLQMHTRIVFLVFLRLLIAQIIHQKGLKNSGLF